MDHLTITESELRDQIQNATRSFFFLDQMRADWCQSQKITCEYLCDNNVVENTCYAGNLFYVCTCDDDAKCDCDDSERPRWAPISLEEDAVPAQICEEWERRCPLGNTNCNSDQNKLCELITARLEARDEILSSMRESASAKSTAMPATSVAMSRVSSSASTSTSSDPAPGSATALLRDGDEGDGNNPGMKIGVGVGVGVGGLLILLLIVWLVSRYFKVSIGLRNRGNGALKEEAHTKPELGGEQVVPSLNKNPLQEISTDAKLAHELEGDLRRPLGELPGEEDVEAAVFELDGMQEKKFSIPRKQLKVLS